jgi:4-hydroxy-tetrahydrodipicolinate synthase
VSSGKAGHGAISGVYPMLFAFFDEAEQLDRGAMRRQVDALVGAGVHGIAALGLATECNKLSVTEKRRLLDWVAEDLNGRLPLSVTVSEPDVAGQIAFVQAAAAAGAGWVVLQPPPVMGAPESELLRFFGAVADASSIPVGLQIAPEYLGIDLSGATLKELGRRHPNVRILKVEAAPIDVAELIEVTEGAFDLFNGRAGLELPDCVRAGCVGMIPGAECADVLTRIFDGMRSGDAAAVAQAERDYLGVAPLITFSISSMDCFLVYAKRVAARRFGIAPELALARRPFTPASQFGLALADRHSAALGPL